MKITSAELFFQISKCGLIDISPWQPLLRLLDWYPPLLAQSLQLIWGSLLTTPGRNLRVLHLNTLRPRQNGRYFADDIFKCIFLNETAWIPIRISLKFVPNGPINNIPALVQIMAWPRRCDKPLSEPMMVSLPTHICVTRSQWVKCVATKWLYKWQSTSVWWRNLSDTPCSA